MKKVIKKSGLLVAIVILSMVFSDVIYGQNSQNCEKIVAQIYEGINQKKTDHLMKYLGTNFSMAGQTGEIAKMIFPEFLQKIDVEISDVKKLKESKSDVLTLEYEAKFGDKGIKKSIFVFDKNDKLIKMDLMPARVQVK